MRADKPFRFGVQLPGAGDGPTWTDLARRVEDLGYSTLFMPDHFDDQLAPVPALMAAAAVTSTLRIGALVLDNDYRHPVLLAKEAATLDVLSGGRLEFGLGAGWMSADYEQAGIVQDRAGVRIARLDEALEICKGLWRDGPYSFAGSHYRIEQLNGLPKPLQAPPPILVGGGGPKVLSLAARHADIIGINMAIPNGAIGRFTVDMIAPSAVTGKVDHIRSEAGSRFDAIELSVMVFRTFIGNGWADRRDELAAFYDGATPADIDASPYMLVGDTARVVEHLHEVRSRWGISYFVVYGADAMEAAAPVVAELAGK